MWKQVGLVLTISAIALSSGTAEARFGKRSSPPPSSGGGGGGGGGGGHTSHPGGGWGGGSPSYSYGGPRYYGGYYPYGYAWPSYNYFDPAWAWPFVGSDVSAYGTYGTYGRYYPYGTGWGRPMMAPRRDPRDPNAPPTQVDLRVDTGAVRDGYSVGVGLLLEGQRFGFGTKLDLFNLRNTDGGGGRDSISLLSLAPSVLVASNDRVKWRLNGGLDVAFAPDITMIGLGLGTGATVKIAGPLKLETNAHLTPLPYVQVSGDAGAAVDLGSILKLRAGYRATYLDDRGNVDGVSHKDLLAGPFVGLSLTP